jgi:hypothetical protein
MRKISLPLILLCALLNGATYYIAQNGANNTSTRDGSQGQPWRTITFALDQMSGGDTVIAMDGIYPALNLGSAFSSMVYVIAQNRHQASILQSGYCLMMNSGAQNICIDGFVMDGADNASAANVVQISGASYVYIRNNVITHGTGGYDNSDAFKINLGSHHILVEGNIVYDGTDEELDILQDVHDIVVRRNIIYQKDRANMTAKYEAAASCKMRARRMIFDANLFSYMNTEASNGSLRFGGSNDGGDEAAVCLALNNAFINSYGKGAYALAGSKKTLFANNVVYNHGGANCLVAIYTNNPNVAVPVNNDEFTIVNNIFYATTATFPSRPFRLFATNPVTYVIDYNLYYNGSAGIPSGGFFNPNNEPNGVFSRPDFTGNGTAVTGDPVMAWLDRLKLRAGSPGIDAGKRLSELNLPAELDSLLEDYFNATYDSWYSDIKTDGYRDAFGIGHAERSGMDMGLYSSDGPLALSGRSLGASRSYSVSVSPHPFRRSTAIRIQGLSDRKRNLSVMVYDMQGRLVRDLSGAFRNKSEAAWLAQGVAAGVYLLKVGSGGTNLYKRMVLVK